MRFGDWGKVAVAGLGVAATASLAVGNRQLAVGREKRGNRLEQKEKQGPARN